MMNMHTAASEFFMPVESDADLAEATAFLYTFDKQTRRGQPHPLDPLAALLMQRIMAYEEARMPPAAPDMELRLQLGARGLTLERLAAATGLELAALQELAGGARPFAADEARALGRFFGVNAGAFL